MCAEELGAAETPPPTHPTSPLNVLTLGSSSHMHTCARTTASHVCGCGSWVTAVCQGPCSLVQMAQPVAPMVPKLPTLIDQGRGSHGLGNVDLLLRFGLWGLWGLFGALGSPSRDSQDNRRVLTRLPPTIYQLPYRTAPRLTTPAIGWSRTDPFLSPPPRGATN